jgi:hypothetical protein
MSFFKTTSLIVEHDCGVRNYLDPFSFWNFKGKLKCAGCDGIFSYALKNGVRQAGPDKADPPHDALPGYAEDQEWGAITDPTKVNAPPKARADFVGKPIPITKSVRGKKVSGAPLTVDDLKGSIPKFLLED